MEALGNPANLLDEITAALDTLKGVQKAFEAIKDAHQQIKILRNICGEIENHLKKMWALLITRQADYGRDPFKTAFFNGTAGFVKFVDLELAHVAAKGIPELHDFPKRSLLDKVLGTRAPTAIDVKLGKTKSAMKWIDRTVVHLYQSVDGLLSIDRPNSRAATLDDLRTLSNKFSGQSTSLDYDIVSLVSDDQSGAETESRRQEYQKRRFGFDTSAFELTNSVIIRSFESKPHSPTTTRPSSPISRSTRTSTIDFPSREAHISLEESKLRVKAQQDLALRALEQKIPDAAATLHAQALEFYNELCEKMQQVNHVERTRLEAQHIRILIVCVQSARVAEGKTRLEQLATDIEELGRSGELEGTALRERRRDVGSLYCDLLNWPMAIHFLRAIISEPGFLEDQETNREEIKQIAMTISHAYNRMSEPAKITAFRQYLQDTLGYDPISETREFKDAVKWCRERNLKINANTSPPCFSVEVDKDGNYPLHNAVCDVTTEEVVLKQLASDKTALNHPGQDGSTPLLMAVQCNHLNAVKVLLDEGASLDCRTEERNMFNTVLHICRDPAVMTLLLERLDQRRLSVVSSSPSTDLVVDPQTVHINSLNPYIGTPLHEACHRNDYPIVVLLLHFEADPNICNDVDESPLIVACRSTGSKRGTKLIVKALVNACSEDRLKLDKRNAKKFLNDRKFRATEIENMLRPGQVASGGSSMRTLDTRHSMQ